MAQSSPQQRFSLIVQIVILVLFCAGIAALAWVFGVFKPPKDFHNVTLRIENPSGSVTLLYSLPGNVLKDPIQASTPWEKTLSVKSGSDIYISALNPSQSGDLKCTILLDGKVWKKETSSPPQDKVFCAGIVP